MATINVLDAAGGTVALEKPLAPGRAAATASRPTVLSTEDAAMLTAIQTASEAIQAAAESIQASSVSIAASTQASVSAISGQTPSLTSMQASLTAIETSVEPALAVGIGTQVTCVFTSPSGALTPGDIIATTQELADFFSAAGHAAYIKNYTVIDTADQKAAFDLIFLRSNTSLGTEDSAPDIDDTEAIEIIACGSANNALRVSSTDYADLGGVSVASKDAGAFRITGADDQTSVWIAAMTIAGVTTGTPTYGSAPLRIIFELAWD